MENANKSTGTGDIYEVKYSQRHLLAAIENSWNGVPFHFVQKKYSYTSVSIFIGTLYLFNLKSM